MEVGTHTYDAVPRKFTGKERDSESGLDNFGARYNSSQMGRFMSPDPSGLFFADRTNPQSLNLYTYVRNNPLGFVDPTGLDCVYFNDAGNGVESIDHNSNSGECGANGGDWVNGTTNANEIQYNADTDTFNILSSDTWHNYNTTASAPGSQTLSNNMGAPCSGNCATGYSQSLKWPSFTLQLGVSAHWNFWGPGAGSLFAGVAIDSHGSVGTYWGGGVGAAVGAGVSGGVQLAGSNGNSICALGGLWVFAFGLIVAIPKDAARRRERREGRRLKGPELVSVREFNRRNRSDGIGFVQQERTLKQKLFGEMPSLNLSRRIESSHILIMGDSGTGKSALIRKILIDVEGRGEAAIVYDPALEYTPQFYSPERGDAILNPLDARMPSRSKRPRSLIPGTSG